MDTKIIALSACNVILASAANVSIKMSAVDNSFQLFTLSMLLNSSSFVLLYEILKHSDLGSNQVVLSSGVIVMSCVNGSLLFKESFNWLKLISIILAFVSIVTMYCSNTASYENIPVESADPDHTQRA